MMGSIGSIGIAIVDMPRQVVKSIVEKDRSAKISRRGSGQSGLTARPSDAGAPMSPSSSHRASLSTGDVQADFNDTAPHDPRQGDKEVLVPAFDNSSGLVVDDPRQEGIGRLRGGRKSSGRV